jgi:hypothetical protein
VRYSDSAIFATASQPFSDFVIPRCSDSVILLISSLKYGQPSFLNSSDILEISFSHKYRQHYPRVHVQS